MLILPRSIVALLCLIALYALGGWGLAVHLGVESQFTFFLYSKPVMQVSVMLFLFFLGWRVWALILFERPKHLTRRLIADVRARLFTAEQIRQAVPIFIGFMVFMSVFTCLKSMIPLVVPYAWDARFHVLDHVLHGGIDSWRLLQPLLGYPWITAALNINYNLWFVVLFGLLYWQLFDLRRPALRLRFFWSFFLIWMLCGTFLAMAFSSAGPCFYGHVVPGENPYAAQMAYLHRAAEQAPVWATATQQALWNAYQSSKTGIGSGISAMPSVHVSMALLFLLLGWRYGRAARVFFIAFFACIFLGSVHLGWHYAVDGYGGALVTLAVWAAMGQAFPEEG